MFFGTVYDKRYRIVGTHVAGSRDECARVLFERFPKAATVTTTIAYERGGAWHDGHRDIRWINRRDVRAA